LSHPTAPEKRQLRGSGSMSAGRGTRTLAWTLGLAGAGSCIFTIGLTFGLGLYSAHALTYLTFIAAGLLGALVVYREPLNGVGWLMCFASLAAVFLYLPLDYGYAAVVVEPSLPLGGVALWLGAWAWVPVICLFLPLLTVRFPDGVVPSRWRIVDWLAGIGTAATAAGVAVGPAGVQVRFLPFTQAQLGLVVTSIRNPLGVSAPMDVADLVIDVGFALVLLAYLASVASVVDRFRHARGDQRPQLKWFAYAGVLIAAALIADGGAALIGIVPTADVEIPFHLSFFALPLAIGIAILRYRLYDIDLIINRSLVYGGMTAILAAAYTAGITLLQRLFVSVSGQRSDAAYVLTAFGIVVGFSPLKDWLQHQVDRRISHRSPSAVLDEFRANVEAVVSVIDVHRVACRLLDQALAAFDARGAALYLRSSDVPGPMYSRGQLNGSPGLEVPLRFEDRLLGRLILGTRRGDATYTVHDRQLLQASADSVGEALALAEHLGFRPLPKSR